jgi:hypothetical protein
MARPVCGRERSTSAWGGRRGKRATKGDELAELTKRELYERAGEMRVEGRSKMSCAELQRAGAKAS